jgi:hypothetical protein
MGTMLPLISIGCLFKAGTVAQGGLTRGLRVPHGPVAGGCGGALALESPVGPGGRLESLSVCEWVVASQGDRRTGSTRPAGALRRRIEKRALIG